jgi:hypothetical protein
VHALKQQSHNRKNKNSKTTKALTSKTYSAHYWFLKCWTEGLMQVSTATRRKYGQACDIARALDLGGERWTLLLARELITGPRSYGQLSSALPGIGTNLLADRLKQLEADGLIEKTLFRIRQAGFFTSSPARGRNSNRFL